MIYRIDKGSRLPHPAVAMGARCLKEELRFSFSFGATCLCDTLAGGGFNRVAGLSLELFPYLNISERKFRPAYRQNSISIGWRSLGECIELTALEYVNGVKRVSKAFNVRPGDQIEARIRYFSRGGLMRIELTANADTAAEKNYTRVANVTAGRRLGHKLGPKFNKASAPRTLILCVDYHT